MQVFISTLRPDLAAHRGDTVSEGVWTAASGLMALAGGWHLLRGRQFARLLLIIWMGSHIALSAMHSWEKLTVHCVIFAVIGYYLMRPSASAFFQPKSIAQSPV